ncbi:MULTISPECIES: hypothetical protein [unclassified Leptolyngbya]|uniref:hypothetical protein n=1 Tax=unclassified Leptolyngbya TaxID=2650499 RepID=UPI001684DE3F|nr:MULTISPECIES: hypothetical protein [unclassified Leptolyngbya]MBD1911412.1 hypothetical protein [Leptolyngbya sp. FACHB-8]MBD2159038.1 hypothetical protein [Leptolyngbya sp. FACHB-16]
MSHSFVRLGLIGGGMAIALSTLAWLSPSASAQVTANPDDGFSNPEEARDVFSDNADMGDVMDMIHRANFSNSRTNAEIQLDRRNNIQNAAELFRQQQRNRLQQPQQQQPQPEPPTTSVPDGL